MKKILIFLLFLSGCIPTSKKNTVAEVLASQEEVSAFVPDLEKALKEYIEFYSAKEAESEARNRHSSKRRFYEVTLGLDSNRCLIIIEPSQPIILVDPKRLTRESISQYKPIDHDPSIFALWYTYVDEYPVIVSYPRNNTIFHCIHNFIDTTRLKPLDTIDSLPDFEKYEYHFDGSFDPTIWLYEMKSDSLIFVEARR